MSRKRKTAGPMSRSWKKTKEATELSEMSFIQLGFGSRSRDAVILAAPLAPPCMLFTQESTRIVNKLS